MTGAAGKAAPTQRHALAFATCDRCCRVL